MTDSTEPTTQGSHKVTITLTDSQYQKLKSHAQAQGFDSVEKLTLDLFQDIFAMASNDPYLAITKRATRLKDALDARLGKTTTEDNMLIPRDVVKNSDVEF